MSSCPTNDIHSVYLDGELPQIYVAEYEAHVASCQTCQALQKKLRSVSAALKRDAAAIKIDEVYKAQGYERLLTRLSYSRVAKKAAGFADLPFKKTYFVPLAAAAAVLLAVVVPLRVSGGKNSAGSQQAQVASVAPLKTASTVSMGPNNVVINGTLTPSVINSSLPRNTVQPSDSQQFFISPQQNYSETMPNVFADVNMFMPQISRQNRQLVLKVVPPSDADSGQNTWTLMLSTAEDGDAR